MFLNRGGILLVVSIFVLVFADDIDDIENYDIEMLENMLRTQTLCPQIYSSYVSNCTQVYDMDINECESSEKESKQRLKEESVGQRKKFVLEADNSCKAISKCNDDDNEAANIFGCLSQQGAQAVTSMSDLYYEANKYEIEYTRKLQDIEGISSSCTNTTTWQLSSKNSAAIEELNKCFRTGKWELVQIVPDAPKPKPTPDGTVVTESPASPSSTSKNEVTEAPKDSGKKKKPHRRPWLGVNVGGDHLVDVQLGSKSIHV